MKEKELVITRVLKWAAEMTIPPPEILENLTELWKDKPESNTQK